MTATNTRLTVPFAAGVVGSLTRPQVVRDILPADPAGEDWYRAARSPQMDAAAAYAIALQETAGLDLVTDGEWRRHSYTNIIADVASGFVAFIDPDFPVGVAVAEPIEVKHRGIFAEEAKFLVESTDRATKVCVPSPYIIGARLWHPEKSAKAYPERESLVDDLVPILHDEIVALRDTGVDVIQIDEPDMAVLLDPRREPVYGDRQYDLDLAAAKINEMIDGIDGVRTAMHMCRWNSLTRGWHWEGGYTPIIDALKKIKVDQYVMEFSIPVAGDVSVIKELPEDSLIGLGSVDPRTEVLDPPERIVERVEEAMRYVDKERLSLNPDCGFAPGIRHNVPLDECYLKLKNEAKAARILREKHA